MNIKFVVVEFPTLNVASDNINGVSGATYATSLPVSAFVSINPSFFVDKNENGIDTLYVIKTTSAPQVLSVASATPIYATGVLSTYMGIRLFGGWPKPKPHAQ